MVNNFFYKNEPECGTNLLFTLVILINAAEKLACVSTVIISKIKYDHFFSNLFNYILIYL